MGNSKGGNVGSPSAEGGVWMDLVKEQEKNVNILPKLS